MTLFSHLAMTLFYTIWALLGIVVFIINAGGEVRDIIDDIVKGDGGWNWLFAYSIMFVAHIAFGPLSYLTFPNDTK